MTTLPTRMLSPALGVEVEGLDLRAPIDEATAGELRELFARHRLVLFRDQQLDDDDQVRVLGIFGDVIVEVPTGEEYCWVSNADAAGEGYVGGSDEILWHSDYMFTPHGALQGLSLYAQTLEQDEPTRYANMVRAVDTLPDDLRTRLEDVEVFQLLDMSKNSTTTRRCRWSERIPDAPDAQYPHSLHPILERHPRSGEPFVDVGYMTSHVEGWSDEESDRLFDELATYTYASENCYEHHWRVGDLVVWDNVALQHARDEFPNSGLRILRRVRDQSDRRAHIDEGRPTGSRACAGSAVVRRLIVGRAGRPTSRQSMSRWRLSIPRTMPKWCTTGIDGSSR